MQTLIFGLTVTAVGVLTVFFGLTVLIVLIKIMQAATSGMGKKKPAAPKAAPTAAPAPAVSADEVEPQVMAAIAAAVAAQDEELIAVISAAVAAMMGEGNGFTVRRIRRVSNAPAWQKSGREEQVYSRF